MSKLNNDLLVKVTGPIRSTWSQIAYDMEQVDGIDNEQAVECCLDSDHLTAFVEHPGAQIDEAKLADKLIGEAIEADGYEAVLKFLSDHIKLY